MKPNPDIALIYHYDLDRALNGEPVDWQAIPVNVQAGRDGGNLCRAAADFAKRRNLFAMPAPTTVEVVIEADTSAFEAAMQEMRKHGLEACKSCGASIIWIATANRKSIPLDPDPVLGGNIEMQNGVAVVVKGRSDESRWISHFVSCPNADEHRKNAAPAVFLPVVEQPATASVPADAVAEPFRCGECGGDLLDHRCVECGTRHGGKEPAADRDRLIARIKGLVDAGHIKLMRLWWPIDVPTLKHDGHTADELTAILTAVRRVEAEVGAAWHPDDGAEPHTARRRDRW